MRFDSTRRDLFTSVLLVASVLIGCRSGEVSTPTGEPKGHTPATTVGDFDESAIRKALQGRWDVQQGARELFYFEIDGDRARAVDMRFAEPRFIEGTLMVRSATGFGIIDRDNVTSFYSAVLSDEGNFIGLGDAIKLSDGDTFEAKLSAWERLTMNGEGECTYTKHWGAQADVRKVECSFTKKGDREIFTYQADDQFRPERLKRYEWVLVGRYLLSRELADAQANKLAEGEPSSVDPGTSPGRGDAFGALGKPIPGGATGQTVGAQPRDSPAPQPGAAPTPPVTTEPSIAPSDKGGDTPPPALPSPDAGPGKTGAGDKPEEAAP